MARKGYNKSGVPLDDLYVLDGCVTRNRALFSPTLAVEHSSTQSLTVSSPHDVIRTSGPVTSDLCSPSEPSHDMRQDSMSYSVSVHFNEVDTQLPGGGGGGRGGGGGGGGGRGYFFPSSLHDNSGVERGSSYEVCSTPATPNRLKRPQTLLSSVSTDQISRRQSPVVTGVAMARINSLDGQRPTTNNICGCRRWTRRDQEDGVSSSSGSEYSLLSSTCPFQDRSARAQYVKGVDGQVFKARMEKTLKWFSECNDQQRNQMLLSLLVQCNCAQLHLFSIHMEPILHGLCPLNSPDLLSWLPSNLVFLILSFLDPVSLCQASQVCRTWSHMASDHRLWMKLCRLQVWQLSQLGEEKQRKMFISPDGRITWKAMFGERFRIRRNWLKGFCNVRTFEGHTQGISCIQFDDTRIVSGSWDKTIKVWNRRTNTAWAALTLTGHSGTVRCLHLHDNRLVSGSSDRTIKVWELSTENVNWVGATCRLTMVGHMHTVRCLQADSVKVISGSYDNTLKVWDLATGVCSLTLRGHSDAVLCLHFHGNKLVSGSKDTTIKVWGLPDGQCQLTLHGHEAPVTCVQFDDTRVISGAIDRLIKIWSLDNGNCVRTIDWIKSEGHTGVIRHLQADGWKIVSAADDKTLKVWSLATGNRLLTLKSHTDGVTCLQFNDEVIVSGSYDKTVKLWDFSVC